MTAAVTDGLFSHPKAEALLSRLTAAVERHDREISSLRGDVDVVQISLKSIQQKVSCIEVQMDATHDRLNSIEQAISIPIPGANGTTGTGVGSNAQSLTAGEGIAANRRSLARTLNLVSNKVDAEELDERLEQERAYLEEMKRDFACNVAIEKIHAALISLVSRVDILAGDVGNKIDRSLFATLSSEVSCIENYTKIIKETESNIKSLQSSLEEIKTTTNVQHETLSKSIEDKQTKILQAVEIEKEQGRKKFEAISQSVEAFKMNTETRLNSHQDDAQTLFAAHETLAKHLTSRLDKIQAMNKQKILSTEEQNGVEKEKFMDAMQRLTNQINTKAQIDTVRRMEHAVVKLEKELNLTKKKANLAAQFITLFQNGGEGDVV